LYCNSLFALLFHAGFACSSGSACKTGDPQPSEVLIAIGIDPKTALGSLRVSLGRETVKEEIDSFCHVLPGVDGNSLVALLDHAGFACSSGSACKTGDPQPSEVLIAIGIDPKTALGSLRVSLGRETRREDIDSLCQVLPGLVAKAELQ
jgi:cysteine sulfinate desulfinase/cysteine desulfurase-like protein